MTWSDLYSRKTNLARWVFRVAVRGTKPKQEDQSEIYWKQNRYR